ncbi:site-specific integrase [Nocardia vinacea]|uniref:Site-specific integrase n=1 Tax=Nocardia vinacea TaxID=96468 RepID=A0ABZ1YP41_9NOCA|nr:site-specific integrase [Nocardia vinacea]
MTDHMTRQANLEAAALLLDRLGLTARDLQDMAIESRTSVPTFAAYIRALYTAMPAGSTRYAYNVYWMKLLDISGWADRRIDEPTVTELQAVVEHFKLSRQRRRNSREGRQTGRMAIAALRYLYRQAEYDGYIRPGTSPAARLVKPRQLPSTRRALPEQVLADIIRVASTTGNDPELDALVLRLHVETACRQGGAIHLRVQDLDATQCVILLREKGGTERWQPVTPTLMAGLLHHARERGASAAEPLLRYRNGRPIQPRRYDYLWRRLRQHLPVVETHGITTHWLRHTTLTWVERNYGKAVAFAYAGHTGASGTVTDIYTRAGIEEVAQALSKLTGEPHPLTCDTNDWTSAASSSPSKRTLR